MRCLFSVELLKEKHGKDKTNETNGVFLSEVTLLNERMFGLKTGWHEIPNDTTRYEASDNLCKQNCFKGFFNIFFILVTNLESVAFQYLEVESKNGSVCSTEGKLSLEF